MRRCATCGRARPNFNNTAVCKSCFYIKWRRENYMAKCLNCGGPCHKHGRHQLCKSCSFPLQGKGRWKRISDMGFIRERIAVLRSLLVG